MTMSKKVAEKLKNYFISLPDNIKSRYITKISLIDNFDPYTLEDNDFNITWDELPDLEFMEIVIYFAVTHSFYSGEQIRAYKSLESFRYCAAGFVSSVKCTKISHNYVALCEVKHSQRMNDDSLWPWLIINADGSIVTAHCTCMAGLGEVCSHVAAVAFAISFRHNEESCTDILCTWSVPGFKKTVEAKKIKDMNWGSPIKSYTSTNKVIPPLQGEELLNFLHKVNQYQPDAPILRIIHPFASLKAIESIPNLPVCLSNLYDSSYADYSLRDLREVNISINISKEEQEAVLKATKSQSKSRVWYKHRQGRITGSIFKRTCVTSVDKPSITTIKAVCYSSAKLNLKIESLQYGLKNEERAKAEYFRYIKTKHLNFKIFPCGLAISLQKPQFGASADALIECDCCGQGCLEVKCPFRLYKNNLNIEQFACLKGSYLFKCKNGYMLDPNSAYYYQIQLQMYCTDRTYCDFVVWSKNIMFVQRINRDESFLIKNLAISSFFYKNVIVPEFLSKCYTEIKEAVQIEVWCHCLKPEDGREMIKCSNELCKTVWFHLDCVDALIDEELSWSCPWCCEDTSDVIEVMEWE